ncbi:MAG: TRAP transporter small permease [Treponema sp.]|nr:TRAP transporter small permease [Treponema sp.]
MVKVLNFLKRLDVTIVTLVMFALFVNVMLQIASRILPFRVVPWTVEMGEHLLVAVIWLGLGLAVLNNSHVRFDMLLVKLPHKMKKIFYVIGNVIFAIFLGILAYHTVSLLEFHLRVDNRTPMLRWNRAYIRAPVLVGCVVGAARMLVQAWAFATNRLPLPSGEYAEETRAAVEAAKADANVEGEK